MAKELKANSEVILHKIKILKDGRHPIALRVTYLRKRKYYGIGERANEEEWKEINARRPGKDFKKIRKKIDEFEDRAEKVMDQLGNKEIPFSFENFEKQFFRSKNSVTVFSYFDLLIDDLLKQKKIGNADVYRDTKNALVEFRKKKDLTFDDITYSFLCRLETFLGSSNAINSISIRMRTIRAAYNRAVKDGVAKKENYPFDDYKTKQEATPKRAIRKEQIQLINNYEAAVLSKKWYAKTYFIFSYLCQGMGYSDLAFLKWSDIRDGRIEYKRVKTISTSKNPQFISIKITDQIQEILDHFRNFKTDYDDYIFPILKKGMEPRTIKNTIKSKRKKFNSHLKEICAEVGIEGDITSYVARHTWATVLKRNGVPISLISQGMDHKLEKTTGIYLGNHDYENLDKANEGLL